jgi:restriction endonuclease Mrr
VEFLSKRIVLIDAEQRAKLMIRHDVGVASRTSFAADGV